MEHLGEEDTALKEWKARNLNYFFVVFGREYADKHPVDGGVYPDHEKWTRISNLGMAAGDVLLLYCGGYYPGHDQEAPGIGVVIGIETVAAAETIYYQYFPLDEAVPWDIIKESPSVKAHHPLNWIGNWIFRLSRDEFKSALAGRQIDWP